MKNIIYKIILGALALSFLVVFFAIFGTFWSRLSFPADFRMFEDIDNEHLVPGEPIAQKFKALENNLSQINILTEDFDKIVEGDKLTVSVQDQECANTIRTAKFAWPPAAPKQFDRFSFDPIPDSKGKIYCLNILYESPEVREERPKIEKMKKTGDPADYFVNLKTEELFKKQTLIFRPAYKKISATETLGELGRRMDAYGASYLKGEILFWIFYEFLILTLILTLVLIFAREDD